MKEQGIIIFKDGQAISYGTYVYVDDERYSITPKHEESFKKEIVGSSSFRLSGLNYHSKDGIYLNGQRFSLDGIIMIFNNQSTHDDPTEILAYMPIYPTDEQLTSLRENENLLNIEIQKVYEFQSQDWDDYIEYNNFYDYIQSKSKTK